MVLFFLIFFSPIYSMEFMRKVFVGSYFVLRKSVSFFSPVNLRTGATNKGLTDVSRFQSKEVDDRSAWRGFRLWLGSLIAGNKGWKQELENHQKKSDGEIRSLQDYSNAAAKGTLQVYISNSKKRENSMFSKLTEVCRKAGNLNDNAFQLNAGIDKKYEEYQEKIERCNFYLKSVEEGINKALEQTNNLNNETNVLKEKVRIEGEKLPQLELKIDNTDEIAGRLIEKSIGGEKRILEFEKEIAGLKKQLEIFQKIMEQELISKNAINFMVKGVSKNSKSLFSSIQYTKSIRQKNT